MKISRKALEDRMSGFSHIDGVGYLFDDPEATHYCFNIADDLKTAGYDRGFDTSFWLNVDQYKSFDLACEKDFFAFCTLVYGETDVDLAEEYEYCE